MTQPNPAWVTTEEGGDYIPWPEWQQEFKARGHLLHSYTHAEYMNRWRIHSVGFDDGSVFDNMTGWRTWSTEGVPRHLLVRMGMMPPDPHIRWPESEPAPVRGFWARLFG